MVDIDDVYYKKLDMLDGHVFQFYEWLPGMTAVSIRSPKGPAARTQWLATQHPDSVFLEWRPALERRYGSAAAKIKHAVGFEITEYGRQPTKEKSQKPFPFFPVH